tara:strand:+ start:58 stop:306 length:249 start_codon:yes stop_codon:yes gene_type:complete
MCEDGSLYTGVTTDVKRRLIEHKSGKGGYYTRAHGADKIVYTERSANRSEAQKKEATIKKLSRQQKLKLIKNQYSLPIINDR